MPAAALLTLLAGAPGAAAPAVEPVRPPDVLLIVVDDLNDWVGHLGGNPQAKTPNIDRLAARGVSFTNAHSPATSCNGARIAVLSGLRPATTGIYSNKHAGVEALAGVVTLPDHFRAAGYRVLGGGKIYHGDPTDKAGQFDDYFASGGQPVQVERAFNGRGNLDWQPLAAAVGEMYDAKLADWAIEQLAQRRDEPLLLAVGFHKPHLPWWVPAASFDRYPADEIELPAVLEGDLDDLPAAGLALTKAEREHRWITDSGKWRDAVRGYLAAVSFVDQQIGRLLDGLGRSGRAKETVVVLWSDHGWHLGEKRHWKKGTLWEETTRIPLVFVAPGVTRPGGTSSRPVDAASIYPTLAELAGLPRPGQLETASLAGLLRDPGAAWQGVALTTHRRGSHAVRDERWRYIRYADGGEELYDHDADPREWHNLAAAKEHEAVKRRLAAALPAVEAADRKGAAEINYRSVFLRDAEETAPTFVGADRTIRLLLRNPAATGVEYEIRDVTDPAAPLYWDGRKWRLGASTLPAVQAPGSPRWAAVWDPGVAAGEIRSYQVRALVVEDAATARRVIGPRRLRVDGVEPSVEIQTVAAADTAGEIRFNGRARDNACLAGVDLLVRQGEADPARYWDGARWQGLRWWLPAALDRVDQTAAAWRYRLAPGLGAPADLRFRVRASDCAGAVTSAAGRFSD